MKNFNFKEERAAAKYISKFDRLFLQRENDFYYISGNGYFLVCVNAAIYKNAFMIESPRFIALENGQRASSNSKNELPEIGHGANLMGCIPGSGDPLTVSPFIYEADRENDKRNARILFDMSGCPHAVNEEYYNKFKCFAEGGLYAESGSKRSGVHSFHLFENTAVLWLPINLEMPPAFYLSYEGTEDALTA